MYGILKLRDQIQAKPDLGWRARYDAGETIEVLGTEGVTGDAPSITTRRNLPQAAPNAEHILKEAGLSSAPGIVLPPKAGAR